MAATLGEVPSVRGFQRRPHLGSAAHRRGLGEHLRRCRTHVGLPGIAAARYLGTSVSSVSRLEKGERGASPERVAALQQLYGITDEREVAHALEIATEAGMPDVWQPHGDLIAKWVRPLLGLEPAAQRIVAYEPQLVPGWLQTEEYAQLVVREGFPDAPQSEVEARARARTSRLEMFRRSQEPPTLLAVMDEDVLRRPVGSPGVMYRQIEHIIRLLKELPYQVHLQIAPLDMGMIGAVGHPIVHLRFADDLLSDFVYLEQSESAQCIEGERETERYWSRLFRLCGTAIPWQYTLTHLEDRLNELARTRS